MTRILMVDDHPLIRDGVVSFFNEHCQVQHLPMVFFGCELDNLQTSLQQHPPDIVFLDLHLGDSWGPDYIASIHTTLPACKVICFSNMFSTENASLCLKQGAVGLINKDLSVDSTLGAIDRVLQGRFVINSNNLEKHQINMGNKDSDPLTKTELKVVDLIFAGFSNKEIASILDRTEGRVKNIITIVLDKLQAKDRTSLLSYRT